MAFHVIAEMFDRAWEGGGREQERYEEWLVSTTHMRVRGNIPAAWIRDIQAFLRSSNKKE